MAILADLRLASQLGCLLVSGLFLTVFAPDASNRRIERSPRSTILTRSKSGDSFKRLTGRLLHAVPGFEHLIAVAQRSDLLGEFRP
jgi:hypothetical protein